MGHQQHPIFCDPRQIVRDFYTPRVVPVIHPVEIVNRQNIVNVPRHIPQVVQRNVVVDPGYPGHCDFCHERKAPGWFF